MRDERDLTCQEAEVGNSPQPADGAAAPRDVHSDRAARSAADRRIATGHERNVPGRLHAAVEDPDDQEAEAERDSKEHDDEEQRDGEDESYEHPDKRDAPQAIHITGSRDGHLDWIGAGSCHRATSQRTRCQASRVDRIGEPLRRADGQ